MLIVACSAVPVPLNPTDWLPKPLLSVKTSASEREPAAFGLKLIGRVQVAPKASDPFVEHASPPLPSVKLLVEKLPAE